MAQPLPELPARAFPGWLIPFIDRKSSAPKHRRGTDRRVGGHCFGSQYALQYHRLTGAGGARDSAGNTTSRLPKGN